MWILLAKNRLYLGAACFAALSLILAVLGSFSWKISGETVENSLKRALQRDTAYTLDSFGQVTFKAFPWPVLDIDALKLRKETSAQERVSVERLRVRLNLASWIWGNPRIVEMRVTNPIVYFASSEKLNETEAVSTTVLNFLRSKNRPDLRVLRVTDAKIFLDGSPWINELFINVQNVATTDLRLRARARYRDIPVSLRADIAQGANPEGRVIEWKFDLPGLSTHFDGRLLGSRSLDAEGFSKTNITDGSVYARAFGLSPDAARLLSRLTITGETKITWPNIQMRSANLQLDQNKLDGSLEISLDKDRPRISATLGAEELDLNERLTAWTSGVPENSQSWPEQPISVDWLNSGVADIRISAERVLIGKIALEKVALASQLREGRLDVVLSDARLKSGGIRGRAHVRRVDNDIVTRGSLQFDQIDLETAQGLIGITRVKGMASGQIMIDAKGSTAARLMLSNEGKGNIAIRNGEFVGLDIERLMTRLDRTTQPISAASGSTRFRSMTSNFAVQAGVVSLADSSFSTLGLTAPVEGNIDINKQTFDLKLRLVPTIAIQRLSGAAIRISGPWSKPIFSPEMQQRPDRS
jgi:AsmA family